jgi:hypothetical protein
MGKKTGDRKIRIWKEERNDCPSLNFIGNVSSNLTDKKKIVSAIAMQIVLHTNASTSNIQFYFMLAVQQSIGDDSEEKL